MDEYIRQLTHDNQQFGREWPSTFDKLHKLSIDIPEIDQPTFKVKSLEALVDYVLADTEEIAQIKTTFLEITIKKFINDPLPSLDELVRIFCRVLELPNTNHLFNLIFLQKFYSLFRLGEHLSSLPSVDLIDSILICLKKHEFLDQNFDNQMQGKWSHFLSQTIFSSLICDKNKLNDEQTMNKMRSSFQQLYR
jgi:hypothetical protein